MVAFYGHMELVSYEYQTNSRVFKGKNEIRRFLWQKICTFPYNQKFYHVAAGDYERVHSCLFGNSAPDNMHGV